MTARIMIMASAAAILTVASAEAQTYRCGDQTVTVTVSGKTARLAVGGETVSLTQVPAASGAKYEVTGDPSTSFWSRGATAMVVVKGKTLPECRREAVPGSATLTARGHEPGWNLDVSDSKLTLVSDYGASTITAAVKEESSPDGRRLSASVLGRPLLVVVKEAICRDSATGLPHPSSVEVSFGGTTLRGCGGTPVALLAGTWAVQRIGEAEVAPKVRVTLTFGDGGRVSGVAGCNNFTGKYVVTGEGLKMGPLAATRKMCGPELMAVERDVLAALNAVTRFDLAADGSLTLLAGDQPRLVVRKP